VKRFWNATEGIRWFIPVYVVVAVFLVVLAGCGDASREDAGDTPRGAVDRSQPRVTAFNNHYPNVETKCAAGAPGWRLFVSTRDSARGNNVIVVRDGACKG
jgi:hypothetical protein